MARVLLQLLCTALTLAFFFYQHNANTQDTGSAATQSFSAKRIKVSDTVRAVQVSDPSKHPDVWLMPLLDRLFSHPDLQHASAALGLTFTSGKTL